MSFDVVVRGDVWSLGIRVAGAYNSFGAGDFVALSDTIATADREGARALVITAEGPAFSAGADVRAMADAVAGDTQRRHIDELVDAAHGAVRSLRAGPPSVVAVNGAVAGAALGLACSADVRIASPAASFVSGFIGIGATPDSSLTWSLPRLVGAGRAAEMILRNRRVAAGEALAWGLVAEVVDPAELSSRALEIAGELADGPRAALRASRRLMAEAWSTPLDVHLEQEAAAMRAGSEQGEFVEGVSAFAARRPADFRGGVARR